MKQGTGNNLTEALASESILSIQQSLDGLSFCVSRFGTPLWLHEGSDTSLCTCRAALPALQHNYPRIRIIIDTDQACMVPAEYFEDSAADLFLRIQGSIPPTDTELKIARRAEFVWILPTPRSFIEDLSVCFPTASVEYLHPLWLGIRRASNGSVETTVDIHLSGDKAHLVMIRSGSLLYAESLPCRTAADLLYLLNELQAHYDLQKSMLTFSGRGAEDFRKQIAAYYKKTALDRPIPSKTVSPADATEFANLIRAAYENY